MTTRSHMTHWGAFEADSDGDEFRGLRPHPLDPDPCPLLDNIPASLRHPTRVAAPFVRAGWLDRGPGPDERRGTEPFVPLGWDDALDLLAGELARVRDRHGNPAIFAGSYGWGSAGRFHHARTHLQRFLAGLGGFTSSAHTYSVGASEVLLPHVVGSVAEVLHRATSWEVIVEHTRLVVAFGGMPHKNSAVAPGGVTRHVAAGHLRRAREAGCEFVLFSPVADDLDGADWRSLRPGTDTAVMLALAHTLASEGLADREFLDRYCAGADRFLAYLGGDTDGQPKTAEWAAAISGVDAAGLRALARRMASTRTLVTTSWSLQRADHGEQPVWAMIALAAMLGQIGLPGGGFGHGYGAEADIGVPPVDLPRLGLPGRPNPVPDFIPVARIADMLLRPGEEFDFDGRRLVYPDIRLVYWCGGNPFHHHQDLNRLRRAFSRPDTVVVHDPFWTATARHADIVLPATTTLEREDIAAGPNDPFLVAMHRIAAPNGEARDDYEIFAGLADRFGCREVFTEGRSVREWLVHLYERWRDAVGSKSPGGEQLPAFEEFWARGHLPLPVTLRPQVLLADFRADPDGHPLSTPSGRIELYSHEIAGFGYADCPGHPAWLEPAEWLGSAAAQQFPLHLVANQPSTRLHSQLDMGGVSQAAKIRCREPMRIHPADAAARGLAGGDVARVFNDRGACLAGVVVSDRVRPGVVQLSTGAWFDPENPALPGSMCVHGNPNVLTLDKGTSRLAQGSVGQHALVEVERFDGPLPPVKVLDPPPVSARSVPGDLFEDGE